MKNCITNKQTNVLPLGEKWIKEYFRNSNIAINKHFWNFIRSFLKNKGSLNSCEIMLRKEKKIIIDTKEIVQVLNHRKINIVERSFEEKRTSKAT